MLWAILLACDRSGDCFEPDVGDWCTEPAASTSWNGDDDACRDPAGEPSWRCGDYDALQFGDGITGEVHYFDRAKGEHVAVEYWSDVREFCGGRASYAWYGERIDCEPTCTYGKKRLDLPPCDDATS